MEHGSEFLKNKKFTLQPRFTVVHHPIREKYKLSLTAYAVMDSVDQLSHRPDYPWCNQSKPKLAKFLGISERTVFNAINAGIEAGLIEKNERGELRSTQKWIYEVRLYEVKDN